MLYLSLEISPKAVLVLCLVDSFDICKDLRIVKMDMWSSLSNMFMHIFLNFYCVLWQTNGEESMKISIICCPVNLPPHASHLSHLMPTFWGCRKGMKCSKIKVNIKQADQSRPRLSHLAFLSRILDGSPSRVWRTRRLAGWTDSAVAASNARGSWTLAICSPSPTTSSPDWRGTTKLHNSPANSYDSLIIISQIKSLRENQIIKSYLRIIIKY